jgi:hypothetical protein
MDTTSFYLFEINVVGRHFTILLEVVSSSNSVSSVRVVDVKIETACFLKYAADLHCILISGKI